jgi:hypothetical protein
MTNPTQTLENEIVEKGANVAPRITPKDIESNIASAYYFTAENGISGEVDARNGWHYVYEESLALLTFCVLVLKNGFTVTGEAACASPENFNAEIGRKIAKENAVQKIWPLMGYELRSKLKQGTV